MSENPKNIQGLFKSVKEVTEYETQWHVQIYQKAQDMALKKVNCFLHFELLLIKLIPSD